MNGFRYIGNSRRFSVAALFAMGLLGACDGALDVADPTAFDDASVNSASGAELLRRGALRALYDVSAQTALASGVVADEFIAQTPVFLENAGRVLDFEVLDRRQSEDFESLFDHLPYTLWQLLRTLRSSVALEKLQVFAPTEVRSAYSGEMLAVRAFASLRLAEDYCPGFPLHDLVDFNVTYGSPLTTAQVFERAVADFEAAVDAAGDSSRILNFARVGRGRALLNLGQFADAAAAVAAVPTTYVYQAEYGGPQQNNNLGFLGVSTTSVADREGGTGLNFVSADDPRVRTVRKSTARDGVTGFYGSLKYPATSAPLVLASGVEARLIEAEAALNAGQPEWLARLNQLRATQVSPALAPLSDPGSASARVDLLFRERAFWLFGTGHRLADLRRLLSQYDRSANSVFPSGAYWRGGAYGSATSIPFDKKEASLSPGVTGCMSR